MGILSGPTGQATKNEDLSYKTIAALVALLSIGILYYSQVTTLDWDEGFHLVAAKLVAAGKRPYVDFCFPQPWLHAWWNSLWIGGGWRTPHLVAALLTCCAIGLTADFVYRRVGIAAGCVAALLVGLNTMVVEFGTKAQAYGTCTFLTVAAFRATLARRAILGGFLAGASAACSLLTAPGCVVLLAWTAWQRCWSDTARFVIGLTFGLSPVLVSLVRAPELTWFNLVEYHVFYRHVGWTGATQNDVEVLTSWVDSGQALVLGLLALAGLWFVRRGDAEIKLAAGMAVALGLEAAVAHPTFPQYFVFMVPFLAMLASSGFVEVASRLSFPDRWAIPAMAALLLASLSNSLVEMRDYNNTWDGMDQLAKKVALVTPADGIVLADPPVYFAMRIEPPPGMEFPASHALELPAQMAESLRIVPQSVLLRRVRAGEFATVETCKGDEPEIQALGLPKLYTQSATIAGCQVYWGLAPRVLSYRHVEKRSDAPDYGDRATGG